MSAPPSAPAPPPAVPRRPAPSDGARPPLGREAARLLLPVSCAGCGRWETALCPSCRALLRATPVAVEHAEAAAGLPILALAPYAGPVRAMVLAWKSGRREDLSAVMEEAGAAGGAAWAAGLGGSGRGALLASRGLLVVPAPSGAARRLRGRLVAARLADAVAPAVARALGRSWRCRPGARPAGPVVVLSADVLRRGPASGGAHQAGRSARQRRRNRSAPPRVLAPVRGWSVLLVDDVVTTGATLGACARALEGAGARILGALVVAAPPPPRRGAERVPGPRPSRPGDGSAHGRGDGPARAPGLSAGGDRGARCPAPEPGMV